ncbi:hypothetical protein ACMX2H_18360 [Arthrobacter sulfonylureivorans]|uniref:hypothetical protein n=1 Tax=Arthrobacter sulfonylureivorans TaxID=2486855 RepID=UPI0039E24F2B
MVAADTGVIVHALRWKEPYSPGVMLDQSNSADPFSRRVVWNAHRPLNGEHMWEGAGLYGIHYACADSDHPDFDRWRVLNERNDARTVRLVSNLDVVALLQEKLKPRYSVEDYIRELADEATPLDAVAQAARMKGLPWVAEDPSADALVMHLAASLGL